MDKWNGYDEKKTNITFGRSNSDTNMNYSTLMTDDT